MSITCEEDETRYVSDSRVTSISPVRQSEAASRQQAVLGRVACDAMPGGKGSGPGTPAAPFAACGRAQADGRFGPGSAGAMIETAEKVVAIGVSTGGTEALRVVLEALPPTVPAWRSCNTCRSCSPGLLPNGWTACAQFPSRRPSPTTGAARARADRARKSSHAAEAQRRTRVLPLPVIAGAVISAAR